MFLYHDIQWGEEITTIGFYSGDGLTSDSFTLSDPTTYTSDLNLDSSSNVGIPGAYFYRVDQNEVILPRGTYSYSAPNLVDPLFEFLPFLLFSLELQVSVRRNLEKLCTHYCAL